MKRSILIVPLYSISHCRINTFSMHQFRKILKHSKKLGATKGGYQTHPLQGSRPAEAIVNPQSWQVGIGFSPDLHIASL